MFALILFNLAATPLDVCLPSFENNLWPMEIDWANLIVWGTWPEQVAWRKRMFEQVLKPPAPKPTTVQKEKHYPIENRKHQPNNQALRRSGRLMQRNN